MQLLSIQVGKPRDLITEQPTDGRDPAWQSGFYKDAVLGPIYVGPTNLEGDGQADLVHHGGPDKAVLAYSAEHYPAWRCELGMTGLPHGAFGENLTISGETEDTACIGDVYAIGEVRLQVCQPRFPCWKISRRWAIDDLLSRVTKSGRTGWYLRVLKEGMIAPGETVELISRPHPEWSVTRATAALYGRKTNPAEAQALAELPPLAERLRAMLQTK